MLYILEFILKILFLVLSIVWIGKIMILRTDKQIIINPLLIGIAALLAVLPGLNSNIELIGMSIQNIRIILYGIYSAIVIFGVRAINQKNGIF
ncbi:hypothetical protein [Romboutsia sp.]|uniref:hypothetical protein n=1 Tax=Romboutsia sp. TaxID=1965302 RepID=UPI002C1EA12A|nr:hypothetical protein [Romboutsia sp.]HSQ87496.1 hypothetical protein [Romboutsia sp.]